ncbi:plasmid mobilization protein [Occallatibacter savannae]|uniref:plasmid mobilization protein n=1 Tax=Occallatibacter savannae TaxID=1002691 RepID=UPI0013A53B75|nr:hypothetical protein [Occallatibacter savannae]
MSQPAQSASRGSGNSFADMLASFAGGESDGWDDSGLEADVSTIGGVPGGRVTAETRNVSVADETEQNTALGVDAREPGSSSARVRRGASITIRVTAEEQSRLQERAAAAKVSVSAYLRSCVFEAEALRAEVKEALAQLKSAQETAASSSDARGRRRWALRSGWWRGRAANS